MSDFQETRSSQVTYTFGQRLRGERLGRHRDQLAKGMDVVESIARTNATAGQAVVVAGGTVMVAMSSEVPFDMMMRWIDSDTGMT